MNYLTERFLLRDYIMRSDRYIAFVKDLDVLAVSETGPMLPDRWTNEEQDAVIAWCAGGKGPMPRPLEEYFTTVGKRLFERRHVDRYVGRSSESKADELVRDKVAEAKKLFEGLFNHEEAQHLIDKVKERLQRVLAAKREIAP